MQIGFEYLNFDDIPTILINFLRNCSFDDPKSHSHKTITTIFTLAANKQFG